MSEGASDLRPEFARRPVDSASFGIVAKPLSAWERLGNVGGVRKAALLIALAMLWEAYARWLSNPLLVPTFSSTLEAFGDAIARGELPGKAWTSLTVLVIGFVAGILCAAVLTMAAITARI